ncbi:MAG: SAM-dependent chlorinase/fluorinase [Bacteroidales bacterium]|nr:SAM-dependent chlorinase/fluorinase [Bacteroidales bacterium]
MEAPIVTLTTDWGDRDYYAGRMKAGLLMLMPNVRVVDISHSQQRADYATTRSVILNACMAFPQGTIHVVDVGTDFTDDRRPHPVAVLYRGHYLLSSSAELLRRTLVGDIDTVVLLPLPEKRQSWTFLAYDLFCPVIQCLASDMPLDSLGTPIVGFTPYGTPPVHYDAKENTICASVIQFDHYGNATLDVPFAEFERLRAGRRFQFAVEGHRNFNGADCIVDHFVRSFSEVEAGRILLTVSHAGNLMVAFNQGSVQQLFGLNYQSACEIKFFD